jgi:prepilin-type processing-associated H-X9-DG protein
VGGEDTPTRRISDGLAKTLMMSETIVIPAGEFLQCVTSMSANSIAGGGQTFTGWNPPNSRNQDEVKYGGRLAEARYREAGFTPETWPIVSSSGDYFSTRLTARSRHKGGVNASRCDGSISFYSDSTDGEVWAALTSARGAATEPELGNTQ